MIERFLKTAESLSEAEGEELMLKLNNELPLKIEEQLSLKFEEIFAAYEDLDDIDGKELSLKIDKMTLMAEEIKKLPLKLMEQLDEEFR